MSKTVIMWKATEEVEKQEVFSSACFQSLHYALDSFRLQISLQQQDSWKEFVAVPRK